MEYLEFLNLDNTTLQKCSKVRSWYLYEQFKSLERNQLDATNKLKDKSLQEKILLQELYERRERRRFCENGAGECEVRSDLPCDDPMYLHIVDSKDHLFSVDESESQSSIKSKSAHSTHYVVPVAGRHFEEESSTNPEVITEKETPKNSCEECPTQVQDTLTVKEEKLPGKGDLPIMDVNSIELTNKLLDTVKQEFEHIQDSMKIYDEAKSSDLSSHEASDSRYNNYDSRKKKAVEQKSQHSAVFVWTKLVSFAYQIMQLSHGNCYYDFSTQILTAILACDILRRGLCKMSDYLQPFICPVKLTDDPFYKIEKQTKLKKQISRKKEKNICKLENSRSRPAERIQKCSRKRRACSEYRYPVNSYNWTDDTKVRRHSEPWYKPSRRSRRRDFRPYRAHCRCCHHTINPMMKLSHFIDKVVNEIMSSSSSRENL